MWHLQKFSQPLLVDPLVFFALFGVLWKWKKILTKQKKTIKGV